MSKKDSIKSLDGKTELVRAIDDEFLAELYFQTRKDEFAAFGADAEQLREFLRTQYDFQKQSYRFQFSEAEHLIILFENEKVGQLIVNRTANDFRLVDISLLPEFRNSGIGTKIIRDLIKEADEKNLPLVLGVMRTNSSAFRLYQNLGFQITDEDEMFISMEWRKDWNLRAKNS